VGERIGDITVRHIDELEAVAAEKSLSIGVIATPASAAQSVGDLLVGVGVRSLLNFAPTVLAVPPEILLRYVDLSIELQVMSFYQARLGVPSTEQAMPSIRSIGLTGT